jgi:hypothetical protein
MNPAIRKIIENMESNGVHVHVSHRRRVRGADEDAQVLPNGGETRVRISVPPKVINERIDDDVNDLVATGRAKCSKSDTFCRDTGANIAFKRAMENLTTLLDRAIMVKIVAAATSEPEAA